MVQALDNQQHAWEFVRNFGKNVFKNTIESARIVASKQPWPFRCFSKPMVEKVKGEMEIMFKRCFQIYWLSIWTFAVSDRLTGFGYSLAADPAQGTRPLRSVILNPIRRNHDR